MNTPPTCPAPTIKPVRGCYVRVGDVLRPKPDQRRKVLWRFFPPHSCSVYGDWQILDDDLPEAARVEPFELSFISWYSLEIKQ